MTVEQRIMNAFALCGHEHSGLCLECAARVVREAVAEEKEKCAEVAEQNERFGTAKQIRQRKDNQ